MPDLLNSEKQNQTHSYPMNLQIWIIELDSGDNFLQKRYSYWTYVFELEAGNSICDFCHS